MKATLKFNLDDFDDKREHLMALKGSDLWCAISQFNNEFLRHEIRKNPDNSEEVIAIYEKVQQKLFEFLDEYDVNLYNA